MTDKKETAEIKIKDIIEREGAEILDFKIFFTGNTCVVRCVTDYSSESITVGDCASINKKVSIYLEETGILGDNYAVEINSPGLDRPLKKYSDFKKVKGRGITLWLNTPVAGKQQLECELVDVQSDKLIVTYKGDILSIEFDKIKLGKEKITI